MALNRARGPPSRAAVRTLALAALIAVPAVAQTVYSWEDADGTHYTDDPTQVPKKAKVAAMVVDAAPAAPRQAVAAAPRPASPPSPSEAPLDERAWRERFIAANRRITTVKQNIAALEASLPPRTECIAQPLVPVGTVQVGSTPGAPITAGPGTQVVTSNGITTVNRGVVVSPAARCQVNPLHDRLRLQIAQEHVALEDAKLDLEQLDRQASYDAVPREWRRGW